MTEITVSSIRLSEPTRNFILHWGDMGGQWGVNRSVAQIHALLFVSNSPLHAEEISDVLEIARSNVSNSLKELTTWDLVRRVPIAGDRRDHFEAEGDVWEMASRIVAMRKTRELDPASKTLNAFLDQAKDDPTTNPVAVERLTDLQDLISTLDQWYKQMDRVPKARLLPLIKLGSKAVDLLSPFIKGSASSKK